MSMLAPRAKRNASASWILAGRGLRPGGAAMQTMMRGGLSRPHDWHSREYVAEWVAEDAARDPVRRPRLREMLAAAPFASDARFSVLDVGAGYGAVTEELLGLFPNAAVTLQDYSEPMLAEAHRRLAAHAGQLRTVVCDLTDPAWPAAVGGPFD